MGKVRIIPKKGKKPTKRQKEMIEKAARYAIERVSHSCRSIIHRDNVPEAPRAIKKTKPIVVKRKDSDIPSDAVEAIHDIAQESKERVTLNAALRT